MGCSINDVSLFRLFCFIVDILYFIIIILYFNVDILCFIVILISFNFGTLIIFDSEFNIHSDGNI